MSELGLIERINREILHPLGLAISRDAEIGISAEVLVASDGVFSYPEDFPTTVLSDDQIKEKLAEMSEYTARVDSRKHKQKPNRTHSIVTSPIAPRPGGDYLLPTPPFPQHRPPPSPPSNFLLHTHKETNNASLKTNEKAYERIPRGRKEADKHKQMINEMNILEIRRKN